MPRHVASIGRGRVGCASCALDAQAGPGQRFKPRFGNIASTKRAQPVVAFLDSFQGRFNFLQSSAFPLESRDGHVLCYAVAG